MASRRGGKKKQQKQPTIRGLEGLEDDVARPAASLTASKPPMSPAVALAKQALSPVVTAAKALTSAAAAVLPSSTMPSIPENHATVNAAQLDEDGTNDDVPQSPDPATVRKQPFLSATAQQLFADDDDAAHDNPHSSSRSPDTQQQQQSQRQRSNPATSQHDNTVDEPQQQEEPASDLPLPEEDAALAPAAASPAHSTKQQLQFLLSSAKGWKAPSLLLCAALLLLPLLVLVGTQWHTLHVQARTLAAQQEQVAAQAKALQELQQQVQDTSAQLPALLRSAHDASSNLSTLAAGHADLLSSIEGLVGRTSSLSAQLGHVNSSQQAGQQAWQLLTAAAGLTCPQRQPGNHNSSSGGSSNVSRQNAERSAHPNNSVDDASCSNDASTAPNATSVLQGLLQQLMHGQQQGAQQLLAQHQQTMLQALPTTIRHEVQQQLSAQLPPPDLALADCGARIIFSTPIDILALQQLTGSKSPIDASSSGSSTPSSTSSSSLKSATALLQQLQQTLLLHMQKTPHALTEAAPAQAPAAAPDTHINSSDSSSRPQDRGLSRQQELLLHRVLLRPAATNLLQPPCIPMLLGGPTDNSTSVVAGPAVLEIQLPQPSHITSVTLHRPSVGAPAAAAITATNAASSAAGASAAGASADEAAAANAPSGDAHTAGRHTEAMAATAGAVGLLPGRVTVILLNSSSCGGPTAVCSSSTWAGKGSSSSSEPSTHSAPAAAVSTPAAAASHLPLKPGLIAAAASVQEHLLTKSSYGAAGRAMLGVNGGATAPAAAAAAVAGAATDKVGNVASNGGTAPAAAGAAKVAEAATAGEAVGSGGSAAGSILADRVILVLHDSGRGGGGGSICIGRVSVQGRPSDPLSFC